MTLQRTGKLVLRLIMDPLRSLALISIALINHGLQMKRGICSDQIISK